MSRKLILLFFFIQFSIIVAIYPFINHDEYVVLLSDLHTPYAKKMVESVLLKVAELKPLHVFVLGDLTEMGKESEFNTLKESLKILSDSKIPYNFLLGNHDVRWAHKIWKTKAIDGALYENFRVDIGDLCFIGIDTSLYFQQFGHIGEAQLRWIKKQLDDCKVQSKIAILLSHHPFGGPSNYTDDGWKLLNILNENVRLTFYGHLHNYGAFGNHRNTFFQSVGATKDGWLTVLSWDRENFYIWKAKFDSDFELVRSIPKSPLTNQKISQESKKSSELSKDLKEVFSYNMENSIFSQPVSIKDNIFVVDYSGNLLCINSNGKLVWKSKLPNPVISNLEVYQDWLIVGDIKGNFYIMDSKSGKIQKNINLNLPIFSIKCGDKSLAIGAASNLYIIKLPELKILNTYDLGGLIQMPAAYKNGLFFQTSWGGSIFIVNEEGTLISKFETGKGYYTAGASTPQIFDEWILVTNPLGSVQAFNYVIPNQKWELKGLKVGYSSVGRVEQHAIVSSIDGNVYILNSKTGTIQSKIAIKSPIYGVTPQNLLNSKAIVGTIKGEIAVFSLQGNLEKKVSVYQSYILLNPIIIGNKVFFVFTDGTIKIIEIMN